MSFDRTLFLLPHPNTASVDGRVITTEWSANDGNEVRLTFTVTGAGMVALPNPATPDRADGLWRTTCFEIFCKPDGGEAYVEMNFSPSGCWAAYAFDGYREPMRDHPMSVAPHIDVAYDGDTLTVSVDIDPSTLTPAPARIGISAVIEDIGGAKSWWALAHPAGPPDFHHDDCFAWRIPAVGSP